MQRKSVLKARHNTAMPYVTSEMAAIMEYVKAETGDEALAQGIHFSSTALTLVRRVMMTGGSIVCDTALALSDVDKQSARRLGVSTVCYIDDPQVNALAEQRRTTRAEVALDFALSQPGAKLLVVGSAPTALDRLLKRHQGDSNLGDLVALAAPTGFASVVQLKERIWESDIPSIVVRGKRGGTSAAVSIVNALMVEFIRQLNL
jgi:precorrin-8X/cobalt-precorrin-8 methylmutase